MSNSSRQTSITLKKGNSGPAVDTRVDGQSVAPSTSYDNSDSSTISEWMDVADTSKYRHHYICKFCKREFSVANALTKHVKNNCLLNLNAKCYTDFANHPYVCTNCGRRYKVRKSLTYHERHECQQYVTCPDCNKKFVGTSISKQHTITCKRKKQTQEPIDAVKNEVLYSQLISSTSDDDSD